jgi:hypothetical protein
MSLFSKKETIVFMSEQQKDAYIEKLQNAHVDFDVLESRENVYSSKVSYLVRVNAADLKKVS